MALTLKELKFIRIGMDSLMGEVVGGGVTKWFEVNQGLMAVSREMAKLSTKK